jgi:post-segregation antitoxin (ccd killing protein)
MNRLTITLDDDLYAMARAHAIASKKSVSKAISDLLRRSVSAREFTGNQSPVGGAPFFIDPLTQLPVVRGDGRKITMEDIQRSIDDEDVRHLEWMGLSPEEIERSLAR